MAQNWWQIMMPLGQGAVDPPQEAIARVHSYLDTVLALRRKAQVDPAVWAIYDRLAQNLEQVDLKGLYQMIPAEPGKDGTKQLQFIGRRRGERYAMSLDEGAADPLADQGDFVTGARFRPLKGPQGKFLLGLSMYFDHHFGRATPKQVGAMFKNMVRWYETSAARIDGKVVGSSNLGPEDLAILRGYSGSFPETYPWAMSLLHVDDLVCFEQRGQRKVTQVRVVLRPNLGQLELRYPKIHQYLARSRTMRDSRFTLTDAKGRRFALIQYTGSKLQLVIRAAMLDGVLVPLEGPDTDVSLDIDRQGVTNLLGTMDLKLKYWGLTVRLERMELPIRWVRTPDKIVGEYRLSKLPRKIEVTGRLWGVFPVWLVDMLIPSNLEKIMTNFLSTLIKGGGGKGMLLSFSYEKDSKQRNLYRVRFEGELADNGFVQLQTRLLRSRLAPRRKARGEIGNLLSNIVRLLRRDLETYRKTLESAKAAD